MCHKLFSRALSTCAMQTDDPDTDINIGCLLFKVYSVVCCCLFSMLSSLSSVTRSSHVMIQTGLNGNEDYCRQTRL